MPHLCPLCWRSQKTGRGFQPSQDACGDPELWWEGILWITATPAVLRGTSCCPRWIQDTPRYPGPSFSGNSSPVPPQGREEAPLLTRPHSKDKSQPSLPELESHREHLPERPFPTHLDWGFARKPGVPSWWQGTNPNVPELCCHPLKGSHLLPGSGMGDLGRGSHFPVSRAILNVSPLPQPRRSRPAPQPRCSSIQPPPCPAMSLGGRDIPRS